MTTPAIDAPDADLLARTQRNLLRFHGLSLRAGPGARREDWPDATALGSGLPTRSANTLFAVRPGPSLPDLLSRCRDFYRSTPSWRASAPEPWAPALEPLVRGAGLQFDTRVPRLVFRGGANEPPVPSDLRVERVEHLATLRDFCDAASRGFGIPRRYLLYAFSRGVPLTESGRPALRLFVGYDRGRPVATSAATTSDGVTGIFFVATAPSSRRRGFAQALTAVALADGRGLGGEMAWLQSSAAGRRLYERMGFRPLCDDLEWFAPATAEGRIRSAIRELRIVAGPFRMRLPITGA